MTACAYCKAGVPVTFRPETAEYVHNLKDQVLGPDGALRPQPGAQAHALCIDNLLDHIKEQFAATLMAMATVVRGYTKLGVRHPEHDVFREQLNVLLKTMDDLK